MKPIDQTTFDPETGNCFSACVASLLEVPLESVPFFMEAGDGWTEALVAWCEREGLRLDFSTEFPAPPDTLCIVGGYSPRNPTKGHAVIMLNGEVVHDPHPDRSGIVGEPWDWITLSRSGR